VQQGRSGNAQQQRRPALVAAGVAEHERDVPPLGCLQRLRRGGCGRQRLTQGTYVQVGNVQVEQQRVEAGDADRLGSCTGVGRRGGVMPGSSKQRQQRFPPLRVQLQHQQMHRLHGGILTD
jgi:hypothetical protein